MKIFRRKRFESEMETELRFHVEAYVEDLMRSGLDRAEAERRARLEFGAMESRKDECRQAWGLHRMDEVRADLRLTFRNFRRNPGFAAIAILSLALGIGANTAIFGLLDAVLFRVLPVREPGQLVFIQNVGTQGPNGGPPYPCFELLRGKGTSFDGMAAFSASGMEVYVDGSREQARGVWVSGNFYELLGVKPLLGRTLSSSDDETVGKGGPDGPVAVISRSYWQERFGGDPKIVGREIRLSGQPVTIIGVMPSESMSLDPGRRIDIAVPMMLSDPAMLRQRGAWWLDIVARLRAGVRPELARAEADAQFQAYMTDIHTPPEVRRLAFDHIELLPAGRGTDLLRTRFSRPLTALMILASLVLLAACVNVASLLLARSTSRKREFAVRLAIGAGRGRLIRQTLTESSVLVAAGSAFGIMIAIQAQGALAAFFAGGNDAIFLDLSLSPRLLLFTIAVSLLTGVAFGILPALRAASTDPSAGFQSSSRNVVGSRRELRLGRAFVVAQIALSMALLAGGGLFIRSLRQIESVDRGFTRDQLLTMDVTPETQWFGKPQWLALQAELLESIRGIPGVQTASWSTMSPLSGRDRGALIDVPGFLPRSVTDTEIHILSVSPEYLETLGIPTLLGRAFSRRDQGSAPKVAILNETAARFYFGNANPIGARVKFSVPRGGPDYEIVAVVRDVKQASLRDPAWRVIYLPIAQSIDGLNRLALTVRTSRDAKALTVAVTREIRKHGSTLLVTNVATMEELVQRSMIRERLIATLSAGFGVLALILSAIGVYGILAFGVSRRTNEIGIRMALGATGTRMIWLVLREAILLTGGGIAVAVPAVIAIGRFSRSLLYGVESFDVAAFSIAILVLVGFAAVAGIVPALRASRLDPMSALRCE